MLSNHLPTDYQSFIHKSRYARWLDSEGRRETWEETVTRYFDYMTKHLKDNHDFHVFKQQRNELEEAVLNLDIMPSMRAMMTAGAALDRNHVAAYNCSYIPIDDPRAFDELLYVLMCGTGVGFSVERNNVDDLPIVPNSMENHYEMILVQDSKEGWASAYRELLEHLYDGLVPSWDLSLVRPAGARLKTFGGRASGAKPLDDLFKFTVDTFLKAMGRRLYPIEVHDICCKIGEVVVVGGVRRSALISLSNLNDDQMRHAKVGDWWNKATQRSMANNSATYKHKPDMETFLREWVSLVESKSGERGMFNREAAKLKAGENGRRDTGHDFGTNPCSEIILREYQFCNLTEVVVRSSDSIQDLKRKIRLATTLGTWQSTLTDFKYLRSIWKKNTEEERLLGVSLTGIMDNEILSGRSAAFGKNIEGILTELKDSAVDVNAVLADAIGIPRSAAITCIKPSGTVSQLVNSASGIHARHSQYYIRTVRGDNKDPLTQFLKDQGIPAEADVMKPDSVTVFSFPVKSDGNCVTRNDMTAIEQLEMWKLYAQHFCEHKPSVTISVRDNEWLAVGSWVWDNFDMCSGISFLPHSEHTYLQAPYQECDVTMYNEMLEIMPAAIDWSALESYEQDDNTTGSQELSCAAGVCEIVDIAS